MNCLDFQFSLTYPNGFTVAADLQLPNRGITAIFGRSGSGKTSFLRAVAGLEKIPQARICIGGGIWQDENTFLPVHLRPVGYVFQESSLLPHKTAQQNLEYILKRSTNNGKIRFTEVCELLEIHHFLARKPDELSGGERQRVAIACALIKNPKLLLMDEPLASLDWQRRRQILPYLERLRELNIPILYVSHSPEEVARLADRIVVFDHGKIVAQGPLTETLAQLDFPIPLGEDRGVVLAGEIAEYDHQWHLCHIHFDGGSLWLRGNPDQLGQSIRLHILARDVSITLNAESDTSILNRLPATVLAIADDLHPANALVQLQLGNALLLSRVTKKSIAQLRLKPNLQCWIQIKSAALL